PLCEGQIIPELSGQIGIQFAHRLGALVLAIVLLATMIYAIRHFKQTRRDLYGASILAFVLVIAQVFSGGFVVLFQLHLYATLLHSMIITILFGVICYMCLQSLKSPRPDKLKR
ncbi:heme A synthase, partial [Mesorhizobium sp. M00.F.Ca.ET.186.01.1.1]